MECVFEPIKWAFAEPLRDWRTGIHTWQIDFVEVALSKRIAALVQLKAQLLTGEQSWFGGIFHMMYPRLT